MPLVLDGFAMTAIVAGFLLALKYLIVVPNVIRQQFPSFAATVNFI